MSRVPNSDVRVDAERWFARLKASDCTAAEHTAFLRWQAVPEHAAAFSATEGLWQSAGKLADRPDFEQLSQQILSDTAEYRRPQRRRFAIAAAVLVTIVAGAIFWAVENRGTPTIAYATQPGERSTIKLADGSELILNFATALDVRLSQKTRYLRLRQGEALFTVVADEKRPFQVLAGDGEVTALGTRFQVRKEAQQVTVTLLEGRVALDRSKEQQHVQLSPGEQLRFTEAVREMRQRRVDPQVVASWTTGRLLFRSTPLKEALEEVNRYSTVHIRVADPSLTNVPISGTFEVGDEGSVVSALEGLFPVRAERVQSEIVLRHR